MVYGAERTESHSRTEPKKSTRWLNKTTAELTLVTYAMHIKGYNDVDILEKMKSLDPRRWIQIEF
jgi:hypothetical protein